MISWQERSLSHHFLCFASKHEPGRFGFWRFQVGKSDGVMATDSESGDRK